MSAPKSCGQAAGIISLLGVSAIVSVGSAQAEIIVSPSATVSVAGGYSTNPYQAVGSSSGDGFADLSINPDLALISERGVVHIQGNYQRSEYTHSYNSTDSYGGSISGSQRLSAETSISGSVSYDSAIVGDSSNRLYGATAPVIATSSTSTSTSTTTAPAVVNPLDPALLTDPTFVDVGLVGLRQRRQTWSSSLGIQHRPDARSTWTGSLFATRSRYPGLFVGSLAGTSNYKSYGGTLGYSRALSERSSVGLRVNYDKVDYDAGSNSSRVISPEVTYSFQPSEHWTVNTAVGVSLTRTKALTGHVNSTALAFDLSACRSGERTSMCVTASRQSSATGYGGVRPVTAIGASWSKRLSERSSVNASAGYTRASDGGVVGSRDYLSGSVGYSRTISRRASMFATVQYQDSFSGSIGSASNVTGRAGISFRLGELR